MDTSHTFWSNFRVFFHKLLIKLALRFKWLNTVAYSEDDLNRMLSTNLPQTLPVSLINIDGELVLLDAKLSMPLLQNMLHIELFCAFNLSFAGHAIYRAHLIVCGTVSPYYVTSEQAIRIKDMKLSSLRLVNDDYAFIGSTTELTTLFIPLPFKHLILGSVQLTLSILKGLVPNELLDYLQQYASGSKQQVLDFHQVDIENILLQKIEKDDWYYLLDKNDFEEQLFAEFGQSIAIENGKLVFKFHLDES